MTSCFCSFLNDDVIMVGFMPRGNGFMYSKVATSCDGFILITVTSTGGFIFYFTDRMRISAGLR